MSFLVRTDINIFSILILLTVLIVGNDRKEKGFLQNKFFTALLISNIWLLCFETLSWALDGAPGQAYHVILSIVNIILLVSAFIPSILWLFFINYQVYKSRSRIIKMLRIFLFPALISTALVVSSPLTGLVFYIDSDNVYHRGPYFFILLLTAYFTFVLSFIFIILNRKKLDRKTLIPLLLFPIPLVIGGVVQGLFYGASLIWSGMTLSILIIYITIQNRILSTDYLTGLFNRRQLDDYLNKKVNDHPGISKFSIMMIDIDDFKKINDTYGHYTGDRAIISAAKILKSSLGEDSFIARYAGDEFVVVLNITNKADLEYAVERIRENARKYNQGTSNPYKLNFSIGYDVFRSSNGMTLGQFIKHVDALMYNEKRRKQLYSIKNLGD